MVDTKLWRIYFSFLRRLKCGVVQLVRSDNLDKKQTQNARFTGAKIQMTDSGLLFEKLNRWKTTVCNDKREKASCFANVTWLGICFDFSFSNLAGSHY